MVGFGSFWKFRKVVKCYNWPSNDAVASLLYADMFELYFNNGTILYKSDESSLTFARIVVSLTLKWEVALTVSSTLLLEIQDNNTIY